MEIGTTTMITTRTIYSPNGESRTLEANRAANEVRLDPAAWSFTKFPPPNWEFETPKYRVSIGVDPSPNSRFRLEPPFASCSDSSIWQYAERPYKCGEIVETKKWPHASFRPLNFAAEKVLDFFNNHQKSRMTLAPWLDDRVHLNDGLSGNLWVKPTLPLLKPIQTVRAYADTR
jgi:hypothetical protein